NQSRAPAAAPRGSGSRSGSSGQGQKAAAPAASPHPNPPNWDTWKATGYSNRYYNKMMDYYERENER
ncbi:hypothetical protein GGI21_005998, partial [Coemansia aciculifera]